MSLRAVTAPIHTKSENRYRGLNPWAGVSETKRQRADTALVMTQLPRRATDAHSFFSVTLVRFSAGFLDDDNLRGAFKAVRDEVAKWLGVDDGDVDRVRWLYAQEPARRGEFAIRVEVQDGQPGDDVERMLRGAERATRLPCSKPAKQLELPKRRCWALLPFEQDGGEPVLTELAIAGDDPPKVVQVRVPAKVLGGAGSIRYAPGTMLALERSVGRDGDWIYLEREEPRHEQGHQGRTR